MALASLGAMKRPIQITFRHVAQSQAIEQYVLSRASKLDTLTQHATSCRVAIEKPHAHSQHGNHYRVRIDICIAGGEIIVGRERESDRNYEDLYAAIDDAFDVAGRRLQCFRQKQRGEVKSHAASGGS